jgi:FtsH-binding integral membrane protein
MGLALTPLYLIGSTPTGLLGIIYSVGITGGIFVLMGLIGVLSRGKIGVMLSLVIALCIGSLILSLVNLFVFNETIYWICSFAILLVFILYVGIDFAIIAAHPNNAANEHAVLCAFSLYTDFIVIFLRLLPIIIRLIGDR